MRIFGNLVLTFAWYHNVPAVVSPTGVLMTIGQARSPRSVPVWHWGSGRRTVRSSCLGGADFPPRRPSDRGALDEGDPRRTALDQVAGHSPGQVRAKPCRSSWGKHLARRREQSTGRRHLPGNGFAYARDSRTSRRGSKRPRHRRKFQVRAPCPDDRQPHWRLTDQRPRQVNLGRPGQAAHAGQ